MNRILIIVGDGVVKIENDIIFFERIQVFCGADMVCDDAVVAAVDFPQLSGKSGILIQRDLKGELRTKDGAEEPTECMSSGKGDGIDIRQNLPERLSTLLELSGMREKEQVQLVPGLLQSLRPMIDTDTEACGQRIRYS